MAKTSYRLTWYGPQTKKAMEEVSMLFLEQWGLAVEGAGKEQLHPGHGVITGTLRRSIHCAKPNYNWPGDDLLPSEESPERGGKAVSPARIGRKLVVSVGSGMCYARKIEELYHFMANAFNEILPQVPRILKWCATKLGG